MTTLYKKHEMLHVLYNDRLLSHNATAQHMTLYIQIVHLH